MLLLLLRLFSIASSFPRRLVFPERNPHICVTFFTCVGTEVAGTVDLQHTYASALTYLEAQAIAPAVDGVEQLRYELVWTDNGGSSEEHSAFLRRGAQARG